MQQLQGHKGDEACGNDCEEQEPHDAIEDVHGVGAEGNQRPQYLLGQALGIAHEKGQGTDDHADQFAPLAVLVHVQFVNARQQAKGILRRQVIPELRLLAKDACYMKCQGVSPRTCAWPAEG